MKYVRLLNLLVLFLLPAGLATAAGVTVAIKDMKFQPAELSVKKGTVVKWVNQEKRQYHSVWFEKAGDPEPEYFFPGESYERQFNSVGSFPYRCGPHPEMTGMVTVTE